MGANKVSISLALEIPGKKVILDVVNKNYELVDDDGTNLCQGYGYFKKINEGDVLVALFTYNNGLYFLCDKLIRLDIGEYCATLKQGFFKNKFVLASGGQVILSIKYKPSSYDADVIEEVYSLISDTKRFTKKVQSLIKVLSESDPQKRAEIDGYNNA